RRRHTRFSRDWSSDVCSSDLCSGASTEIVGAPDARENVDEFCVLIPNSAFPEATTVSAAVLLYGRICTSSPASANQPRCNATYKIGRASCRDSATSSETEVGQ